MGWIYSKFSYKSGKWPEYKVGEEVYVDREVPNPWLGTGLSPTPTKYIIKEVSKTACGGIINREFVYVIVNTETNMVTINVYESELKSAAQPLGYYKPDHRHTEYEYLIIGVTKNLDRNEVPSFYNDNILELTYDSRTNTYSLWFDSTITDSAIVRNVTLLLMSLSLEGYSNNECARIQRKYIEPTLKVGNEQLEGKYAWIAKSIYILVARRFIWDDLVCHDEKDEYIKTHPSAEKVYRPDKKYIKE
jgi:hypothetical protein